MPRMQIAGGQLWYFTHGSADSPPVLLLHGLGSCGADWLLQASWLERDFLVIAPDLRGHGRSSDLERDVTIELLARDMVQVLSSLLDRPAHVIGLSLGGMVALQLGIEHQPQVKSLTLVNTFGHFRTSMSTFVRGAIRSFYLLTGRMDLLAAWLASGLFPKPEQAELRQLAVARLSTNSKRNYICAARAIARFNVRNRLGEITVDTLIVAGERDRTVPYKAALLLKDGIVGAQLKVVADSGHATPIDSPDEFNRILGTFLHQVEAQATESAARLK